MRSSTESDACDVDDLVVRARSDRDAMGRLYDRFYPTVHRYCWRRLFDRTAAEDVTSEVFLQVAANMHRFAGSTGDDFRCWVFRIATNAVNAHQRRRSRRDALLSRAFRLGWWNRSGEPEPGASIKDEVSGLDWAKVEKAFRALGPRERTAVSLRYMEGLSFAQVAKIMGEREGTLRVVVSRALQRLRDKLTVPHAGAEARGGRCS
jgi:RNA polymerase sigma-70 factor (ECF subfamily)